MLGVDFSTESPRFVYGVRRHIVLPMVCACGGEGHVKAAMFSFALREPIVEDDRK